MMNFDPWPTYGWFCHFAPDFFTSVINQKLPRVIGATILVYVTSFFFWAGVWYAVWR